MKTALILHGIFSTSKDNWFPWLKKELEKRDWKVISPDLPKPKRPDRKEWLKALKNLTQDVDFSELTVVAHSLGVPAALDLVESENKKLHCLVSVAGFAIPYGFKPNEYYLKEKSIDLEKVKELIEKTIVIHSDNDPYVSQDALRHLAKGLGVKPTVVKGAKHFNAKAGYTEFPLILELLGEK